MTEQLQAKMQIIDKMTDDEIKSMSIFEFNEFATGLYHRDSRTLLVHFFDRLGHIIKMIPSVDFGYSDIEGISLDFNVVEVTIERLLDDLIPALKKFCPEIPSGIERELSAIEDIYNTFSEKIREELDSYLEE